MTKRAWGIYAWVHVPTGRMYVGQTCPSAGFRARRNEHLSMLRRGVHHSRFFQYAWSKYGESEFEFVVLEDMTETSYDRDALTAREQWWMDNTNSVFNAAPAAGSTVGFRFSAESRALMRERKLNKPLSPEHRAALVVARASVRGVPRSPEVRAAISRAKLNKPLTAEHRANLRAGQLRRRERQRLQQLGSGVPDEPIQEAG